MATSTSEVKEQLRQASLKSARKQQDRMRSENWKRSAPAVIEWIERQLWLTFDHLALLERLVDDLKTGRDW